MAIGKSKKIAKYVEDASFDVGYTFVPADVINISITADHRVIDGATAARFAATMKSYIEKPSRMLMNMN